MLYKQISNCLVSCLRGMRRMGVSVETLNVLRRNTYDEVCDGGITYEMYREKKFEKTDVVLVPCLGEWVCARV
jgi:hypothetical protein